MINRIALNISSDSGVTSSKTSGAVSPGRRVMTDGDSRAASCESRMPDCLIKRHVSSSDISTRGLLSWGRGDACEGGTSGMDAECCTLRWRAMEGEETLWRTRSQLRSDLLLTCNLNVRTGWNHSPTQDSRRPWPIILGFFLFGRPRGEKKKKHVR